MINQERVRQMSRLAMMESDMGENVKRVCAYRRIDYVLMEIVKGFFAGTVCFAALLLLWFCFLWDDLNTFFADAQFEAFFVTLLKDYGYFMAIYFAVCAIVAVVKYNRCKKKKNRYLKCLQGLRKAYLSETDTDEDDAD